MELRRMLSGDPTRNSLVYLAIGGLSLAKAVAVRNDPERFRRELVDAALFIGVGLLLRRYGKVKAQKRADLVDAVPDWAAERVLGESGTGTGSSTTRTRTRGLLGSDESASGQSLASRARRTFAD